MKRQHVIGKFLFVSKKEQNKKQNIQGSARQTSGLSPRFSCLESHIGTGSYLYCSISLPVPFLWPGKSMEDSPKLGTLHLQRRPERSFWVLAFNWLSSDHCDCLGSDRMDGASFSLSLLHSASLQ